MTRYPPSSVRSFLRDPIVLATLVVNGAVALFTLFPLLDPDTTYLLLESYALVPISLLAMVAPWVGLPPTRGQRETVFWALWSLSLFIHLVVRVIYLILPDVDTIASGAVVTDVLYVLFYLPLILSVLVRPDWPWLKSEGKGPQLLEYAGTGVFVAALLIYFTVIPRVFNQPEYETWVPSLLLYWVLDAFLLLTLLYLRQTAPSKDWRILYTWLAVAALCWSVTELLELRFYLDWDGSQWATGPMDALWYLPWIAITFAGRMRAHPLPAFLGSGHRTLDGSELSRSLGRPGWLQVTALALPVMHIGPTVLGLLDPSTRTLREMVVLVFLVLLLGISSIHQKVIEARALSLTRRSRKMEERQRLLAAAVEQSQDAVLISDGLGLVQYANRAHSEWNGGLVEPVGASLLDVIPKELKETSEGDLALALADGRAWEGRVQPAPGSGGREEIVTISPVRDPSGEVAQWVLIRRDITYLNQLERQFRQAQRMEAVGPVAAGFAQDFNDLVKEIYGHGEALKGELDQDSSPYREVLSLLTATERAAELVAQVQAFTGTSEDERVPLRVEPVVREALALLRPTLPPTIRLVEKLDAETCEIRGHAHQIHQMVLNLVANSIQAMEGIGGTLGVELDSVSVGEADAEEMGLKEPGDCLRLIVRDTGKGIDPQAVDRILDPYFTTKSFGMGSGLGLTLVRETITGYGGGLRVESEAGLGTLFQIYLPCCGPGSSEPVREGGEAG